MQSTDSNPGPGKQLEDLGLDLRRYWQMLVKRRWVALVVFTTCVASVTVFTLRQARVYSASAAVVIDMQMPQVLGEVRDAVEVGTTSYWYSKEFYETQYRIIKSRSIAQRVVDRLELAGDASFLGVDKKPKGAGNVEAMPKADAAAVLQSRLFVDPVKDSRIVNIRVEDQDPERATRLANAVADEYMQANLERRVEGAKDAAGWLQDQLSELKEKLSASELALYEFKKASDLVYTTLENKQTIVSQKLIAINDTLTRIRTRKAEIDARVQLIRQGKAGGVEDVLHLGVIAGNPFVNALKLKQQEIALEVSELAERYGPDHPKLKAAEERLRTARQSMSDEVESIIASSLAEYDEIVSTEANLTKMLQVVKEEALDNNKKEMDYRRLARDEESNQRLYEIVIKRLKELDLSSLLKTNNIRILDPARINTVPIKPRLRTNLAVAFAFGLVAAIGVALLVELQDRSIKGHDEVKAIGLNLLGLIPSIPGSESSPASRDLYISEQPKSSVAECCRTIRTSLLFTSADKPIRKLVVTSAGPQEGKTTTLISLGITLALGGSRVLLVDTDMRRPRLHKSFALRNEHGVSNLIVGDGSIEDAIQSTSIAGLFVLPSGPIPPNPAELLHSERFRSLAGELEERFDRVIFDSPPVGAVTDPLVLANQMDAVILVVKMYRTNVGAAEHAVKSLRDASGNVIGAVLNDVPPQAREYGAYSGYYYGKYYGDEDSNKRA